MALTRALVIVEIKAVGNFMTLFDDGINTSARRADDCFRLGADIQSPAKSRHQ